MYHYQPLRDFLAARSDRAITMSFEEIEQLIGRSLPASARGAVSRQWWANAPSHSQARAWLSLGRKAKLNLANHEVTFSRPVAPTTLPDAIKLEISDLHSITVQLIESVVADSGLSVEAAVAAILNSAANDRRPKP